MQSTPSAVQHDQNVSPSNSARNTQLIRRLIASVAIISIGIGWYFVAVVYPRPIAGYDDLESQIGKRVTFTTIVDRQYKAYELVYLDDKAIRFSHVLGGIDWAPEPGEVCRVVGNIEYEPNNMWGIPYRLSRAEYFPLPAKSQDDAGI